MLWESFVKPTINMEQNETMSFLLLEPIARVCHQANKAWCDVNGDDTQKNWEDAEPWQKESAIKGVAFRIGHYYAGHDAQHNSWMEEKLATGWVYGLTKDSTEKTHPCLVPFEELPEWQQKKDAMFCAIVDSLTGMMAQKEKEELTISEQPKEETLSYGEQAVGSTFNPSGFDSVGQAKQSYANVINQLNDLISVEASGELKEVISYAIKQAQGAQMWAVKALTYKY